MQAQEELLKLEDGAEFYNVKLRKLYEEHRKWWFSSHIELELCEKRESSINSANKEGVLNMYRCTHCFTNGIVRPFRIKKRCAFAVNRMRI